jgi:hypothetical protein
MKYMFRDKMYFSYETPSAEDKTNYEYQWYETSLFKLFRNGSRDELERLGQDKLTRLRLQNSRWNPYAVIRDNFDARPGESPTMRPVKLGFRLEKMS